MRKTLIAVAAVSAALVFASVSYASPTINSNNHVSIHTTNVDSGNGKQSVSGALNEEAVTGNGATGIYNNAAPNVVVVVP
jgi:hypothetical protein